MARKSQSKRGKAKPTKFGTWHTIVFSHIDDNGKRQYVSFTADSEAECNYLADEFRLQKKQEKLLSGNTNQNRRKKRVAGNPYLEYTVGELTDLYIQSMDAINGKGTTREYKRSRKYDIQGIMNTKAKDLTSEFIQAEFNAEAKKISFKTKKPISPKTLRNRYALMTVVLKAYVPEVDYRVKLPRKRKPSINVPSDADIQKLMSVVAGTPMEIPILLSAFCSLRRGEICAIDCEKDIVNGFVVVDNNIIKDDNNEWVESDPKNFAGTRNSRVPQFVLDKLPAHGMATTLTPDAISKRFMRILKNNGIPHFRFHELRHYYASIMHALNIPDQYVMLHGGWGTKECLNNVYQHPMAQKSDVFSDIAMSHFEQMQKQMQKQSDDD